MRGRKPKPTALKILQGNPGKRRLNHEEPKVPTTMPKCPGWMGKRAKWFWKQQAEELNKIGLLSTVDQSAFGAYCNALAILEAANADIDVNGIVIIDPLTGPKKNPAVNIAKDCWIAIKGFSVEFGLTPSSRSRVKVNEEKPANPLRALLDHKR